MIWADADIPLIVKTTAQSVKSLKHENEKAGLQSNIHEEQLKHTCDILSNINVYERFLIIVIF